jgi:hypothetical protein
MNLNTVFTAVLQQAMFFFTRPLEDEELEFRFRLRLDVMTSSHGGVQGMAIERWMFCTRW